MTTRVTINFQFPRLFFKIHTSESFIVLFSPTKLARLFPLKEVKPSSDRQVIQYTQFQLQVPRENKTNWFPERPDIKCFVRFLDFRFNSNKRITEAYQNSRLGTYKKSYKFNS